MIHGNLSLGVRQHYPHRILAATKFFLSQRSRRYITRDNAVLDRITRYRGLLSRVCRLYSTLRPTG